MITISQLIQELQALQAKHGDLVVAFQNTEHGQHNTNIRLSIENLSGEFRGPYPIDPDLPETFIAIAESG